MMVLLLGACATRGPEASKDEIASLPRKSLAIEGAGYSISYFETGDPNGRLVVFVHGTPGDAARWADYLIDVPKGFRYIALDRPGFGKSGPDDAVASLSEQARAVTALVRAQRAGPAILVGHSLGGPIVTQAAVDAPNDVAALVLLAASLDPQLEHVQFLQHVVDTWLVGAFISRPLRNANRELIPLKEQLEELAPRLGTIKTPVVIVHGTKDDLVPYANVGFIKRNLTGVSQLHITTLKGQNHFLPWTAKAEVNAAIAKAAELVKTESSRCS
jgi:pimeloyl-ACP methyl ester carboxylesterase